jgi:hypothetical protein
MKDLSEALKLVGQTPCEKYNCAKLAECAEKAMACDSYMYYVANGRSFPPNFTYTLSVTNRMTVIGASQSIEPSQEIYNRMQIET